VRAADRQTAVARLRETARRLDRPLDPEDPRIRLVPGDLARPALGLDPAAFEGLAGEVDHIFHCGAFVHHLFDYRTLRADNVGSVIELLRLAGTSRRKVLNYVSTLSVASVRGPDGRLIEIEPGERPVSTNGYVMTKWVAEQILHRHAGRGLAVNVFRPGNITGHSLTGACLPDKNHALLLVKGCLQLGCAPDWPRPLEMTPVDILARALVGLALDQPGGGVFNMNNPVELDWAGYLAALGREGYPCALVGLDEWRARLAAADDSNALYPLRELYLGPREDLLETATRVPARQDSAHTQQALRRLGLAYPEDYGPTLRIAIGYLRESGFFPPPVADRAMP
jgi:thioester reductase-like protein